VVQEIVLRQRNCDELGVHGAAGRRATVASAGPWF